MTAPRQIASVYLDTSAAVKLLVEEPESAALGAFLDTAELTVVSTVLLETELRRAATRLGVAQTSASEVVESVQLFSLPRDVFRAAGLIGGPSLRSLDALHVEAASRLVVDAVVTYDVRMVDAASRVGLLTLSPGAEPR